MSARSAPLLQEDGLALALLEALLRPGPPPPPADRVLATLLRGAPALSSLERAAVARRGLGTLVLRGRFAHLLGRSDPRSLLGAYLVTEERADIETTERRLELPMGALAPLASPPSWPTEPLERLAAEYSFPLWLSRLFRDEWGDEAPHLMDACNRPGPITLRANRLRNDRETLQGQLSEEGIVTEPSRLAPDALRLVGRANLFGSKAWREGRFEVQDEGSQLIVEVAAPRPGMTVLDLCAGAGGKTLALAARMENQGSIAAADIDRDRLTNLKARLARNGVTCVSIHPLPGDLPMAELVLVDAPCSSLGTLRRSPDARWRLTEEGLDLFPPLQRELLDLAATRLLPGGRLVYATCTLHRAENEEVVARFQAEHPAFRLDQTRTWTPHREGCDGFFVAVLASPLQ